MKKYMAYMRCGFLEGCAYRSNFITGMLANFIQAAVLYYCLLYTLTLPTILRV